MARKQGPAVHQHNLPVREHLLKPLPRHFILRTTGPRQKHSPIHNQEIRIGCRQTVIIKIQGIRHRKRHEPVPFPLGCPETPELVLHLPEFLIMGIIRISTLHICYSIHRTEPRQSVHMTVCIVPDYATVVQPQHPVQSERSLELAFNLLLSQIIIPVYTCQAFGSRQKGTASVRVYAAAFQYKRTHVHSHHIILEHSLTENVPCNLIVKIGSEFQSPTVEHEIVEVLFPVIPMDGYASVVPRPCIIQRRLAEHCPGKIENQTFLIADPRNIAFRLLDIPADYQQRFEFGYIYRYVHIALQDLVQRIPFSVTVRPCKLDTALMLPFSRNSHLNQF